MNLYVDRRNVIGILAFKQRDPRDRLMMAGFQPTGLAQAR